MVVLVVGTLVGNHADLLRAVDIDERGVPGVPDGLAHVGIDHFAERGHVLQVGQRDPTLLAVAGEPEQIGWVAQQVVRILSRQPLGLLEMLAEIDSAAAGPVANGKVAVSPQRSIDAPEG